MNKNYFLLAILFTATFSFSACEQKANPEKTGNTTTEDMVEGADGGLDSLNGEPDTTGTNTPDTTNFQ